MCKNRLLSRRSQYRVMRELEKNLKKIAGRLLAERTTYLKSLGIDHFEDTDLLKGGHMSLRELGRKLFVM